MKVSFRESGGFAPILRGCELDTDTLPTDDAARLKALVEASGILTMQTVRSRGMDIRVYDLTVQTDRGSHQVTFDQLSLPDAARPLLDFLRLHSRDLLEDDR
jgi:hypothetical protein